MDSEEMQRLVLTNVVKTEMELGRGAYGYVVELKVNGLRCAGKCLHNSFFECLTSEQKQRVVNTFANECIQHSKLHHPNIVQCLGVYLLPDSDLPMLVMECMLSSLTSCLEKYNQIPSFIKYRILLDVACGLCFLHDCNPPIVHRDLTSNNVLLSESLQAKIADFGVSRIIEADKRLSSLTTVPGSPVYMPPEALVANPSYDKQLDIFSLGVLVIHVEVQILPLPELGPTRVDDNNPSKVIGVSEVDRRANFFKKMADETLATLAKKCLSNDPKQRPQIQQIISELESLISKTKGQFPFSNMLEATQQVKKCQASNDVLIFQAQNIHSQLVAALEDLRSDDRVCLSTVSNQIDAAAKKAREMADGKVQDSSHFVVCYKHPIARDRKNLLKISNSQEFSIVLQPPVNMRFSGTYVKTIASGLSKAWGVTVNTAGRVIVVDNAGWDSLLSFEPDGERSSLVKSARRFQFSSSDVSCWYPTGVALVSDYCVIVADSGNRRLLKLALPMLPSGEVILLAKSEKNVFDGGESVSSPVGIAVSRQGEVIACDRANHRLVVLDSNLSFIRTFGSKGEGPDQFRHPWDVAFDSNSNLYVSDCSNHCIKVFTSDFNPLRTIGSSGNALDNLRAPSGICIDQDNFLYVTDKDHRRIYVFDPVGNFKFFFGHWGYGDGQVAKPLGLILDTQGFLYVTDGEGGKVQMFA